MQIAHINLVARDADALARFYIDVLNCEPLRAPKVLSGEKVGRGNGLPNAQIYSIWLRFPGLDRPFLEIHQHAEMVDRDLPRVNEPGFGHLSFAVDDVHAVLATVIKAGGTQIGEITDFGTADKPFLIAYARDPEGNVLEFEEPG
ncbi:VOC family protein [Rhizobium oryzicola]|uniref:VOC family protein n=1 Tax=Rhizobium oryzicola TaxID=1232668 RepID=A0ABT8SSX6_9HYPH|nr:VOC family protein [Rhizobium oryzicola]MDO1581522.1 VOC family protein [Rhizobium oryzicola]